MDPVEPDPVALGLKMPFAIMQAVADLGMKGEDLVTFGIMMDVALGSVAYDAVHGVGLKVPPEEYRKLIASKLERLGLVKA